MSDKNCTTHHHACDCREDIMRAALGLAGFYMEANASSDDLYHWHVLCEQLVGTPYPHNRAVARASPPQSTPATCQHPIDKLLWYDGSLHCFKCRETWHKDFPAYAGPPKIWGKPVPPSATQQSTKEKP